MKAPRNDTRSSSSGKGWRVRHGQPRTPQQGVRGRSTKPPPRRHRSEISGLATVAVVRFHHPGQGDAWFMMVICDAGDGFEVLHRHARARRAVCSGVSIMTSRFRQPSNAALRQESPESAGERKLKTNLNRPKRPDISSNGVSPLSL